MKKWLVFGLSLMAILLFGVLYVSAGKKFDITYSGEVVRPGYETAPAEVRVSASTNIKWKQVPAGWKITGFIFWVLIIAAAWFVGTDQAQRHKKPTDPGGIKNGNKLAAVQFIPVLLCLVCWLAGYSSSLAEGQLVMDFDKFKKEFQISDEQAAKIKSQELNSIKDENGLLTAYFKSK